MSAPDITLSVVSHGQNALVNQLLEDIQRVCADRVLLVVTENVPGDISISSALTFKHIENKRVKGFGANHNTAFERCKTPYFCVCNPDIRLPADPFPPLLQALKDERSGVAGPLVRSPAGRVEDSARRFPTFASLLRKAFRDERRPDYPVDRGPQPVDWVAGMFMLFRSDAYREVGGYDEAYFLYYEDVDICARLQNIGRTVIFSPAAEVVHAAQRASRRDPRLALQHLKSIRRYLLRRGRGRVRA